MTSWTSMFNECTFRKMLLTSWERHLSKPSLIIDDDVMNLLYCKTSSSTGFENESEFFWRQNGSISKRKT